MKYMKIFDDREAERLQESGAGEIICPYYALMEEYIDCALDALEEDYNLTKEERENITPELYEESRYIELYEDTGLEDAQLIVYDKLEELKGEK